MKLISIIILFLIFITYSCFITIDKTVEITITGIRNNQGEIRVGVCKDDDSFQKEKSFRIIPFKKQNVANGILHVKLEIEHGEYGFSFVDDENSNVKMDYNFIGLPKEGFGFSNYYHSGFTKPHFNDFKFKHLPNQKTKVLMKVRYI
jgi:uncharacterized protein (DUF2141 family)